MHNVHFSLYLHSYIIIVAIVKGYEPDLTEPDLTEVCAQDLVLLMNWDLANSLCQLHCAQEHGDVAQPILCCMTYTVVQKGLDTR